MPDPLYSQRFTQAKTLTAADTVIIAGPSSQVGTRAVLALTNGNVVAAFNDNRNTQVTFPVVAGTVYHFNLAVFYAASTATLLGLW